MCESCKAILKEAEKKVGKRKRTEDVIYDAMDKICDQDVFRTYQFIPPEMKRGCQMLLQDYFADEDLAELLYKNKPGTDAYDSICGGPCGLKAGKRKEKRRRRRNKKEQQSDL